MRALTRVGGRAFKRRAPPRRLPPTSLYDYGMSTVGLDSISTTFERFDLLSNIVQGLDYYQRRGRRILVTHVHFRATLGIGDNVNSTRVLFYQAPREQTLPTWSVSEVVDPLKGQLTRKYADRVIINNEQISAADHYKAVDLWIPVNQVFRFSGTGADTAINTLWLGAVSDSGVASHPGFRDGSICVYFRSLDI